MKTYFLPEAIRPELKKIWGVPLFDSEKEVLKKFQQFIKERGFKKIITVGDYCSLTLPSDIKIFDGKIKREKIKIPPQWRKNCLKVKNPPSTIQKKVWLKIKKAIRENKNIFVEGEEDLLVTPAVLLSNKNTLVVYGFPGRGVCVIEVSIEIKKTLRELLKKFASE